MERALTARDRGSESVQKTLEESRRQAESAQGSFDRLRTEETAARQGVAVERAGVADLQRLHGERRAAVSSAIGDAEPRPYLASLEQRLESLKHDLEQSTRARTAAALAKEIAETAAVSSAAQLAEAALDAQRVELELNEALVAQGFATEAEVGAALLAEAERIRLRTAIAAHDRARDIAIHAVMGVDAEVLAEVSARGPLPEPGFAGHAQSELAMARVAAEAGAEAVGQATKALEVMLGNAERGAAVRLRVEALKPRLARAERMNTLVRGGGLAAYAADRYLGRVLTEATANLRRLSKGRYDLLKAETGFAVRDHFQADVIRAASTLSGGESFLASLALALALSDQIQHRGSVRFDFFFMDEGFGSLDAETLEVAIEALEHLRGKSRVIGTISHVPQLHERLPRRLVVERAPIGGSARVRYEES